MTRPYLTIVRPINGYISRGTRFPPTTSIVRNLTIVRTEAPDLTALYAEQLQADPDPTPAERMVAYFRDNGDRMVFALTCFALGMLFADGLIYLARWTVLQ